MRFAFATKNLNLMLAYRDHDEEEDEKVFVDNTDGGFEIVSQPVADGDDEPPFGFAVTRG